MARTQRQGGTATTATEEDDAGANLALLRGRLSSPPGRRDLPSGEVVHTFEVTIREEGRPTVSVPVVLEGAAAPAGLDEGTEVVVIGRVRRRFFRAGSATASRTEVLAERIVPAARAARVRPVLSEADRRVSAVGG